MEETRQHSPLGRAKLKAAYDILFWTALVALAATFVGWLIDRQLGFYAFCAWLTLAVARAAVVVVDGALFGSIIYAPDRLSKSLQPWNYWMAMTFNSLIVLGTIIVAVIASTY